MSIDNRVEAGAPETLPQRQGVLFEYLVIKRGLQARHWDIPNILIDQLDEDERAASQASSILPSEIAIDPVEFSALLHGNGKKIQDSVEDALSDLAGEV